MHGIHCPKQQRDGTVAWSVTHLVNVTPDPNSEPKIFELPWEYLNGELLWKQSMRL